MNINWEELTVDAVTILYMYGTLKRPHNLLNSTLTENNGTTVNITNVDDFMKNFRVSRHLKVLKLLTKPTLIGTSLVCNIVYFS